MQRNYLKWLAAARIYVGILWFEYGTSKFYAGWAAPKGDFVQATQDGIARLHGPVHDIIAAFVLPNAAIFAWLVAIGETAVGISLILGLFKSAGAAGGMFLSFTYYLATGKYTSRLGVESLEALLCVFCTLLLVLPSAQWLSVDALLKRFRSAQHVK